MMKKEIDIILPCYNPKFDWEQTVLSQYHKLQSLWPQLTFHLYIVNDGSIFGFQKKSIAFLKKNISDVHILSYSPNKGKGFALRKAIEICCSDYLLYTDHDFPYSLISMSKVIEALLEGVDVVVPMRDKQYYASLPLVRCFVSKFVQVCNRYLMHIKYPDTQAGLKGFNRQGRKIFLSTHINTYLVDWEFVYKVCKNPFIIARKIQVELKKDVQFSNFSIITYIKELNTYWKEWFHMIV